MSDELYLFFNYLGSKVLKEINLNEPLETIFYQTVQDTINKYWVEYDKILSHYVAEAAKIGMIHYDILKSASEDYSNNFQATKAKNTITTYLGNSLTSSETNDLFMPNPEVSRDLERNTFEASEKTKNRVTNEINEILAEGYREGWGPRAVADKIQQRFTELKTYEARRIAQTEINTTRNYVQYSQLQEDGMEYKIWHAAHDSRTRKSHLKVDEEIVPINERFSNGLMYPGDKDGPIEEWVNCRCSHAAFIMPLGFTAPDFWPFTEKDLVKVGSSVSRDYIPEILERLRVIEGGIVEERKETNIPKPEPVKPVIAPKPKPKKPKVTKPKPEPAIDVNRMSSNELYESMTKADKAKYDKAKQSIENMKKSLGVNDPLFKKFTDKHFKTIRDLEAKQRQKLLKKHGRGSKPKATSKPRGKSDVKQKEGLKKKTGIKGPEFDKLEKWADKRLKNKIEYGAYFDKKTGKVMTEKEVKGATGKIGFNDKGEDYGTVHTHNKDGFSFPSDQDIISYRCEEMKDHLVISDNEIWHIHAEESLGPMGKLTQMDVSKSFNKCMLEGKEEVEALLKKGKIKADEKVILEELNKRVGDKLLKEFNTPYWKGKGFSMERAYR